MTDRHHDGALRRPHPEDRGGARSPAAGAGPGAPPTSRRYGSCPARGEVPVSSSPSGPSLPIVSSRRASETVRVLLLLDREVLARVVTLALRHGDLVTRTVETVPEALRLQQAWQ